MMTFDKAAKENIILWDEVKEYLSPSQIEKLEDLKEKGYTGAFEIRREVTCDTFYGPLKMRNGKYVIGMIGSDGEVETDRQSFGESIRTLMDIYIASADKDREETVDRFISQVKSQERGFVEGFDGYCAIMAIQENRKRIDEETGRTFFYDDDYDAWVVKEEGR